VIATETRRKWLEERQKIVTGSDVSCLFGVHPFGKTAAQLYDEKIGVVVDGAPTGPMKRGIKLEPIAIEEYVEETGRVVTPRDLFTNPEFPWLGGTIDGEQEPTDDHDGPGTLEVKCPGIQAFNTYINHGLHEGYILQEQTYSGVYGHEWGTFTIFHTDPWKLHWFDVEPDDELFRRIVEASKKFMEMVKQRIRPEGPVAAVNVKAVGGLIIKREDPEWAAAWNDYWEAKELAKTSEGLIVAARSVIEDLCGKYGSYEGAGTKLHWKIQNGKTTFDHKRLALAGPLDRDLVIECLKSELNLSISEMEWLNIEELALDLNGFFNQGAPFPSFRPYHMKVQTEEE